MTNAYYAPSGQPISASLGRAANIRAEFDSIEIGFDEVETAIGLKANSASPTFTGQASNALGSTSLPSYTFTGDANTGMWSPGADTLAWSTGGGERMRLTSSGQLLIGTTSATGVSIGFYGAITGATDAFGNTNNGTVLSGVTGSAYGYNTSIGTQAAVFVLANLTHNSASQAAIGAGSSITNQIGYRATSSLSGATNNFGFVGDLAAAASSWNFYAGGSAKNHFNGRVLVGTASENASGAKLQTSDGITFPATDVASSDANTLDDYEEGAWTPSVSATSGTITTLGAVSGTYTKIGRWVKCFYSIAITTNGTAAGALIVGGIPVARAGSSAICGYGREELVVGTMHFASEASTTSVAITTYNTLYPGANGYLLRGYLEYFTA